MKQNKTGKSSGAPVKRRRKLYEIIASATDFPSDAISSVPTFTLRGMHEVEADVCDGILEYNESSVTLAVGKRRVSIRGDALILSDFSSGVLYVRGNIASISLAEDGNA